MKHQVLAIILGMVTALCIAIWLNRLEAMTGIIGVLGTVVYKALRLEEPKK